MMDDEKAAYIASHPEVMTMPLPAGWLRLDSMPLTKRCDFLNDDGTTYGGVAPSNAAFLVAKAKVVAWRPHSRMKT